jgi:monothiol glutaredoxin
MAGPTTERIKGIIAGSDVVLFMKGVPAAPQCGFSAAVVQILSQLAVPFQSVDVLSDPQIREGIKVFSDWPTIPQLYVKGEFVGGCDIVREMFKAGELATMLNDKGIVAAAS